MKARKIRAVLLGGLAALVSGCGLIKFDSISTGVVYRPIKASYNGATGKGGVALLRIQGNNKLDRFGGKLDAFLRFDLTSGEIKTSSGTGISLDKGFVLGGGLSYYPFSGRLLKRLSFDLGCEAFYADAKIPGGVLGNLGGDIFGWGVFAGVTTSVPITKRVSFVSSIEYGVGGNKNNSGLDFDFDGPRGFFGFNIGIPYD